MATGSLATQSLTTDDITSQSAGPVPLSQGAVLAAGKTIAKSGGGAIPLAIAGVTDGSNAAAGEVGEYVEATRLVASKITVASGSTSNLTASPLSLTAGDWDVTILVGASVQTPGQLQAAISETSNSFAGLESAIDYVEHSANSNGNYMTMTMRKSLAATTNIYGVVYGATGLSTDFWGRISARRVR